MASAAPVQRDYYEVLGIARNADAKQIKDAFRQLALKYHPDRNKEPGAEERFKEIAQAYAVLSDPKLRARYDGGGMVGAEGFAAEDLFRGIDFGDIFGGLGFDFGGGLFERLFGRRAAREMGGADIDLPLEISLERVLNGGEETVRFNRPQTCSQCHGSGAKAGTTPKRCEACGGTGRLTSTQRRGNIAFEYSSTCAACGGRGSIIENPCPSCAGTGRIVGEEKLTVRIPAGIEEGTALRVPGQGEPSGPGGGPPGDLYVIVRSAPRPGLVRDGQDLWLAREIGVADAALGTTLKVDTLDGQVSIAVPPGTQPDDVLRLRHKGLPPFGGGRRGELYVRLNVLIPRRVSAKERAVFEQLRSLESQDRSASADRDQNSASA